MTDKRKKSGTRKSSSQKTTPRRRSTRAEAVARLTEPLPTPAHTRTQRLTAWVRNFFRR